MPQRSFSSLSFLPSASRRHFLRLSLWSGALLVAGLAGCNSPGGSGTMGGSTTASTSNSTTSTASTVDTGDEIVIGHFGSLTGSAATFGKSTDNGIRMAFDEINAKGGVLGKKLNLITEDDGSLPAQVPGVVQKLINQSNVLALMGEVASTRSLAAAPIAQQAKVPMISPTSTNPKVTKVGNYIFRTCFIDPFQGPVMARFGRQTKKFTTAAILTDVANDYSKGLTEVFAAEWEKLGGKIVARESYSAGDTNFADQLTNIKKGNPDVIFIPGYYTEVGNIAVQARRQGLNQPLMGCDGWDSEDLYKIGGKALQGCYFSNHYSSQSTDPAVQKFVAAYKAKYNGETPDGLAAVAYDAAGIVADAIKRAGVPDRAKLRDALATTKNYPGVTGKITIDKDRNAMKPIVVLEIDNSKEKFITRIDPK